MWEGIEGGDYSRVIRRALEKQADTVRARHADVQCIPSPRLVHASTSLRPLAW